MQDYCIAWTIGRCGDAGAAVAMQELRKRGRSDAVRRMAHQAWLMLAGEAMLERHAAGVIADWPAWLREAWAANDEAAFDTLTARADQWQALSLSDWLEQLADVALAYPAARRLLLKRMHEVPLRVGLFRAVRHIYKTAELRADAELLGIIHHRFETSSSTPGTGTWVYTRKGYVRFAEAVKSGEFAYSTRTRVYLLRRTWRTLRRLGERADADYVPLAIGALLAMDGSTAGKLDALLYCNGPGQSYLAATVTVCRNPASSAAKLIDTGRNRATTSALVMACCDTVSVV